MNTAVLDSEILSKKREKASRRVKKAAKGRKHETAFDREAIDRALDESVDGNGKVLLYEVDMNNPQQSVRKIIDHARRAK